MLKTTCSKKWVFILQIWYEALDLEKSEFGRDESGEITWIKKHVFIPENVKDQLMFKDKNIFPNRIYFTDKFLTKFLKSSLGGFEVFKSGEIDCQENEFIDNELKEVFSNGNRKLLIP